MSSQCHTARQARENERAASIEAACALYYMDNECFEVTQPSCGGIIEVARTAVSDGTQLHADAVAELDRQLARLRLLREWVDPAGLKQAAYVEARARQQAAQASAAQASDTYERCVYAAQHVLQCLRHNGHQPPETYWLYPVLDPGAADELAQLVCKVQQSLHKQCTVALSKAWQQYQVEFHAAQQHLTVAVQAWADVYIANHELVAATAAVQQTINADLPSCSATLAEPATRFQECVTALQYAELQHRLLEKEYSNTWQLWRQAVLGCEANIRTSVRYLQTAVSSGLELPTERQEDGE